MPSLQRQFHAVGLVHRPDLLHAPRHRLVVELGNYEVNAEFHDPAVARRMEQIWAVDEANCVELTLERWQRRTPVAKFTEGLLSPWRPFF